MIKQNDFYQLLFEYSLGIRQSRIPKSRSIAFRIYNSIIKRHQRNRIADKFVTFGLKNQKLTLNTTHRLPFSVTFDPLVASNVGRICKHVSEKYAELRVIDIGANVGDTVFFIKQEVDCPILCIEGNSEYLDLLRHNIGRFDDVELEASFVGEDAVVAAKIVSDGRGTSTISKQTGDGQPEASGISFRSLEAILARHPNFTDFKLLKIDTDGYDCDIIRNSAAILERQKPVLFFEYAPAWMPAGKDSGVGVFEFLADIGYSGLIAYSGIGEILMSCETTDRRVVRQIHEYFARARRFGDILALPSRDSDLHDHIEAAELQFARGYFG